MGFITTTSRTLVQPSLLILWSCSSLSESETKRRELRPSTENYGESLDSVSAYSCNDNTFKSGAVGSFLLMELRCNNCPRWERLPLLGRQSFEKKLRQLSFAWTDSSCWLLFLCESCWSARSKELMFLRTANFGCVQRCHAAYRSPGRVRVDLRSGN